MQGGSKKSDQKTLETYCRDLCEDARQGRLDPVSLQLLLLSSVWPDSLATVCADLR